MIATLFGKKKISEEKLANVFVNAMLELSENGFPAVAAELNEAPEFVVSPEIKPTDDIPFTIVIIAGNLIEMERTLGPGLDKRMNSLSISKFAQAVGHVGSDMELEISKIQSHMTRLNAPSKNTVYAMGKVLFHQYELFCFQDTYFREMKAPNPIVLKRLNGLMNYFIFDWEDVKEQYRIV